MWDGDHYEPLKRDVYVRDMMPGWVSPRQTGGPVALYKDFWVDLDSEGRLDERGGPHPAAARDRGSLGYRRETRESSGDANELREPRATVYEPILLVAMPVNKRQSSVACLALRQDRPGNNPMERAPALVSR